MNEQSFKSLNHAIFNLRFHLVLIVKYRHPVITEAMIKRLEFIIHDALKNWRCELVEFGGEKDHVHILFDAHPALDLSRFIGNLKTVSSRRIRKEFAEHLKPYFWKPYFWSKSYAVRSVSNGPDLETLIRYVQNQETPLD